MRSRTLDAMSLFIGKVFDAGIMFIFNILAAKLVGIEAYGVYVFISSTVMLISILLKLGLDQGITVMVPRDETIEEKGITVATGLIVLYGMILLVLALLVFKAEEFSRIILNDESYSRYLMYYAPILLVLPFTQIGEGIFRSVYRIRYYVIGKSILMPIGIMGSFLIFYYALKIDGLTALFYCNYIGFGVGAMFMLWHMIKEGLIQFRWKGFKQRILPLIQVSLPLIFLGLHEYLIGRTDAFVTGYFLDEANVGVFNIADKVAYIASFILVASGSIVAPEISRAHHNKALDHLAYVYHESTKLLVIVNTLVFFGLVIVSRWFMDFSTGGDYDGWIVLILLSLAYMLHSMFGPVAYMNAMTGSHAQEFRIGLIMILSNLALDVILLRYMGIKGVALGTVVVFLIGDLYRMNEMHQQMGIRPLLKNGLIPVCGLGSYIVIVIISRFLSMDSQFVISFLLAVIFTLLYSSVIYLLILTENEKKVLKDRIVTLLK